MWAGERRPGSLGNRLGHGAVGRPGGGLAADRQAKGQPADSCSDSQTSVQDLRAHGQDVRLSVCLSVRLYVCMHACTHTYT